MSLAKQENNATGELVPIIDSEKALIAMVKQGDQGAFKKLYELHIGKVYALCFRLTGSKTQAEEATQEVFLKVWQKIQTFKGESQFSTWLHSLSRNTTLSYIRRQKNWKERIFGHEQYQESIEEAAIEPSIDLGKLDSLLPKLPQQARIVFVLHAIEGYRHEQIAKELRINLSTSKAHFHRAKNLISQWLEEMI